MELVRTENTVNKWGGKSIKSSFSYLWIQLIKKIFKGSEGVLNLPILNGLQIIKPSITTMNCVDKWDKLALFIRVYIGRVNP
jgi:hypothetical protein